MANYGTLNIYGGTLETYTYAVNNQGTVLNIFGGTLSSLEQSAVFSSRGNVNIRGGHLTGAQRGTVYLINSALSISGAPVITCTSDTDPSQLYIDSGASVRTNDGATPTPSYYSGAELLVEFNTIGRTTGDTVITGVNESCRDLFRSSVDEYDFSYEFDSVNQEGMLKIADAVKTLTWYDENGDLLSGGPYIATAPYGQDTFLPNLPALNERVSIGWLYSTDGGENWQNQTVSVIYRVLTNTCFKRLYAVEPSGGDGSEAAPYEISTVEQLQGLAAFISKNNTFYSAADKHYRLEADLDLSTVCGATVGDWLPIGTYDNAFNGIFDGQNHTISNLYIDNSDITFMSTGLFGSVKGTVKNLTLTNASVSGGQSTGMLAGSTFGATITNCSISGFAEGKATTGGLIGYSSITTISDCTVNGEIHARNEPGALCGNAQNCAISLCDYSGCVVYPPDGYTTDASRTMAYRIRNTTIDIVGYYNGNWILTVYANDGYQISTEGLENAAVELQAGFASGGRYVRMAYTVTAIKTAITDGKLAFAADTKIGDNDAATIQTVTDSAGKPVALKMVDTHSDCNSKDAQFNLVFCDAGGVTNASSYWFGVFSQRFSNAFQQIDTSSYSNNDSGLAVSWQGINLAAGESKTFSAVLGVGRASATPQWVRTDSPNPVRLTMNGNLISVSAGIVHAQDEQHTMYYDIDGGEEKTVGSLTVGDPDTINTFLSLSGVAEGEHTIRFWVVNTSGATSEIVSHTVMVGDGPQPDEQRRVTARTDGGGSIAPYGQVELPDGSDFVFTITPDEGFIIADVKLDGVSILDMLDGNTLTLSNVLRSHQLRVSFKSESVTYESRTLQAASSEAIPTSSNTGSKAPDTGTAGGSLLPIALLGALCCAGAAIITMRKRRVESKQR